MVSHVTEAVTSLQSREGHARRTTTSLCPRDASGSRVLRSWQSRKSVFSPRTWTYPRSIVHIPPCKSTLVDAEGRLGTPRPHGDHRPGCQNSWGIDLLTNLGADRKYRRRTCASFYIHAHPRRVSVLVEETGTQLKITTSTATQSRDRNERGTRASGNLQADTTGPWMAPELLR